MKKYINLKTGAIIDSSFVLEGENWELYEETSQVNSNETFNEPNNDHEENNEDEVDLTKMKKDELVEFAKKHQIEIDSTQKKDVIIDTIAAAFD